MYLLKEPGSFSDRKILFNSTVEFTCSDHSIFPPNRMEGLVTVNVFVKRVRILLRQRNPFELHREIHMLII